MHFFRNATATVIAIAALTSPVQAAGIGATQLPKSSFDGAHTTNWDPSSVNRIESLQAKLAKSCGVASFYGPGFHGRRTASGEVFNQNSLTTASRHLPFGAKIRVTNQANGKSVIVTSNDSGPFVPGRILDLSQGAFSRIASPSQGLASVCYERIS
jgi:rare lipoprotein A